MTATEHITAAESLIAQADALMDGSQHYYGPEASKLNRVSALSGLAAAHAAAAQALNSQPAA